MKKLKDAELALKATLGDVSVLKKQSSTDHEIIAHLDIQTQDLQSLNTDLTKKCDYLQASLNLQTETTLLTEKRLTAELAEIREKYEHSETSGKTQKV